MTPHELGTICDEANRRYRGDFGTLAEGMLTTGLLRVLLQLLRERGWQAPEGEE